VKILLAYPLAIEKGRGLSPEQVREELGGARAELATLRHRAFMADETIRTLEMNVTGFTAAIDQFERSLPTLDQKRAALLARLEQLMAEAVHKGMEIEEEVPEPVLPQESLLGFFRRHRDAPPRRD
jgi:chromosome segregation ATPase